MKTESITSLYSPLHSKVESGVEIATLAENASNISLQEQSSKKEISQDVRSFEEHFYTGQFLEASENERKLVCLSLARRRPLPARLVKCLLVVSACLATILIILILLGKPRDVLFFI